MKPTIYSSYYAADGTFMYNTNFGQMSQVDYLNWDAK